MSLSVLPTELLEHIASHLLLPSFCSFRLTSRHCHIFTIPLFKHRFFSTQYVSWTQDSLQRLAAAAAHPELGNALRHLVIDAAPRHALSLWKMARRSADAGHLTPVTDDEDGTGLVCQLSSDYNSLQRESERAARWFNETRFDVRCLKKAFTRIEGLERVVFEYEGLDIRYSKFAKKYCEESQSEMSRPFVSTMSALAGSGTSVKRIEMSEGKGYGAVSVGRLESLAPSLRAFDALFEELQVLKLKLRDWRTLDEGFELERVRAPFSVRFLAKCRNVRVLVLSFYSSFEDDVFGELIRVGRFERLENVTLELRVRQASDLLSFFESSRACLEEVRLKHVMLDEYDMQESGCHMWKQIFGGFVDEKRGFDNLRVFHAERMFYKNHVGSRRLLFKRRGLKGMLHVEGEHWRAELRDYMETCLHSVGGTMWESGATAYPFIRSDLM